MTVTGLTLHHGIGVGKLVIQAHEGLAIGIEALNLRIHMIERIVLTTLAVFRLVIDSAALDLYFTRGEVTLEVLHIRSGIPQTPLLEREEFQRLGLLRLVLQGQFLHLGPFLQGHEE